MSEEELEKFIAKVNSLKDLVASLDENPDRKDQLAACNTHQEVVEMARLWGFEISRRWGDLD